MIDIEEISNKMQEWFETSLFNIMQGGFLGEIAFFNAKKGELSFDIITSIEVDDDILTAEENENILKLFNLLDPKTTLISFFNENDLKIQKSGFFVEEYELQQITGYYFHISHPLGLIQIEIFPGNFAIPILLGGEPEIPEISRMEFIGDFDEFEEIAKIEDIENIILQDSSNNHKSSLPLKKPKLVGRNDPCPCGSGIKYKKCCGKLI